MTSIALTGRKAHKRGKKGRPHKANPYGPLPNGKINPRVSELPGSKWMLTRRQTKKNLNY